MSAPDVPHNESGWLDLIFNTLSTMLDAVGDIGSNLFTALRPHVERAWQIARGFIMAHPHFKIALIILVFAVLLVQPLAKCVVTAILGFTPSGIQAGSIAAQIQAALYGGYIPKGSIFSFLQSFGAL